MSTPVVGKRIPLLDVKRQTAEVRQEIEAAIGKVLDHGKFILGPEVAELEAKIADYCGCKYAIGCASGSDAILLALMAVGTGPGDYVITTPFTFFATAGCVSRLGAIPLFVDIDPATFNIDPAKVAERLEALSASERRRVKAILPVHLYGQCADMDAINEIGSQHGVPVIEDAAQAIGAEYKGRRSGSLALCGCFSFFPSKNLPCFGDGGMITTNDAGLADKLRILRVHGSKPKYYHKLVGCNSRLDTLQAAVLLVNFKYLETRHSQRRHHAELYRQHLAQSAQAGCIGLPLEVAGGRHVYNQFVVRVPARDEARKALDAAGISTEVYYPVPLHQQECFASLGYAKGTLPESERAAQESLALPIDPVLGNEDIAYVAENCGRIVQGRTA